MNMPIKVLLRGLFFLVWGSAQDFLRPEKINRPQPRLNPRTVDLEATNL